MAGEQVQGFIKQINEDILDYQEKYGEINEDINKPEWALNYWVLDKFFSVDEDVIFEHITDYNDKGVDSWIYHEETNDLYIIQNKYYNDGTSLSKDYVMNDFLVRPTGALENGSYTRSLELQKVFSKHRNERNFTVHLNLYITNEKVSKEIAEEVKAWNESKKDKNYVAKIFKLSDMYEEYFGEMLVEKKQITVSISTKNKGTILEINNADYGMNMLIDAKYVATPITDIYQIVKQSKKEGYQIFDKNIREFLGISGKVNKQIEQTLRDSIDRNNFFFYNNGITIICDETKRASANTRIDIKNPQIVNGCQTVSTIYEVLDSFSEDVIEKEFSRSYVMAKILEINKESEKMKTLYEDIVRYNNSQNSIQEKQFSANRNEFYRLQSEFNAHGFYLCVKQSDSYKFKSEGKLEECIKKSKKRFERFGLDQPKKLKPFIVDLEKLLQVLVSFIMDSHAAVQNKSKLLKEDEKEYNAVLDFIKADSTTINTLLDLYCMYLRAEQDKGKEKSPNTFMLIDGFSKFECDRESTKISDALNSKNEIDKIISQYRAALKAYYTKYKKTHEGKEYNDMIKDRMDYDSLQEALEMAKSMLTDI